ncbi:MAG TPA: RNA polymerase sigma factor [Solirubrobacteraceae bacterium]|nr:RNA polymerase sigma factor [Solirubrobacteraceae bacterium]
MDAVAPLGKPQLAVPGRLLKLRSDAALAERFGAGDEAAFAVLYERHRPSVIAVCMGVLGSTHDAEDAAQDTFTALAGTLRSAPPRELRPWLTRVARNAAIDVGRRRRRTVPTDAELLPDVAVGPSNGKAELESVMAGIRELPENQRTALLMRELAGHSYVEIAALLEVDEEAVRGLIARARVSLRAHREASEMSCLTACLALAEDPHGGSLDKAVRRHIRGCGPCRAYGRALRDDARALRGLTAVPATGVAGSGAIFGGLAAKGALLGGALTQVTAACAVSACAVGGVVLLAPHPHRAAPARIHHAGAHRLDASARPRRGETAARSHAAPLGGTVSRSLVSGRAVDHAKDATRGTARGSSAGTRARTSRPVTLTVTPTGPTPGSAAGAGAAGAATPSPSAGGTSPSAAAAAGWRQDPARRTNTGGYPSSPGTGYGGTSAIGGSTPGTYGGTFHESPPSTAGSGTSTTAASSGANTTAASSGSSTGATSGDSTTTAATSTATTGTPPVPGGLLGLFAGLSGH